MSIETLKGLIPDYAKDIKLNLSSLANEDTLNPQQLWGCFLASALAAKNETVIREIAEVAKEFMDEAAMNGAKSAASIMAMNNIYYRFLHISSLSDLKTMPAKLRMNVIGNPGVEKTDFELWSLAVSVVNGCGMCIDAHAKTLSDHNITNLQIQTAARIASVVNATACVLTGEQAMSGEMTTTSAKAA